MELEEEIYITKISYIEPIFEGGLQVLFFVFSFFILTFFKVAVQLYLIYMMTTKVDKSSRTEYVITFIQDRGFLDFRNFAYDEGDSW